MMAKPDRGLVPSVGPVQWHIISAQQMRRNSDSLKSQHWVKTSCIEAREMERKRMMRAGCSQGHTALSGGGQAGVDEVPAAQLASGTDAEGAGKDSKDPGR